MSSIRQNRIENVIKEEIAGLLQRHTRDICLGALVSVTVVRITSDLSYARVYLSIFGHPDKNEVLNSILVNMSPIKKEVAKSLKNMRKVPELQFRIDDSLDYAEEIDRLLKK